MTNGTASFMGKSNYPAILTVWPLYTEGNPAF